MGSNITPPICEPCDRPLRVYLCGNGTVVHDMVFTLSYCPECGMHYDAWWSSNKGWRYEVMRYGHIKGMRSEQVIKLCAIQDAIPGYKGP